MESQKAKGCNLIDMFTFSCVNDEAQKGRGLQYDRPLHLPKALQFAIGPSGRRFRGVKHLLSAR